MSNVGKLLKKKRLREEILNGKIVVNHERQCNSEHISERDRREAQALLVLMQNNTDIPYEVRKCLREVVEGKEHICSEPSKYIHALARGYGYNLGEYNERRI